ncbi:MAG: DNA alkylation repair protein [Prevotella sp.]|nr:DNA alkylation repair protein [Prevotella sp.]
MNIEEQHKEIKLSFRLLMNGVTAQSLREKGLDYHLNWGVNLLHLHDMAKEYKDSAELASLLWKDDIRECKILAAMLMPPEAFPCEQAMQWIEGTHTQEIAEIASKYLYSKLPYAKELALKLLSFPLNGGNIGGLLHAYCILGALTTLSAEDNPFSDEEKAFITSQANAVIEDTSLPIGLRHAARNVLLRLTL